ncbi:MAG: hypothetical protein AB1758_12170, partial [Candidatus Eremiobacterota bacterium]
MSFASLPLDEQLDELSRHCRAGQPAEPLLDMCADLSDPSPLSHLCRELLQQGWLEDPANRALLGARMVHWPEILLLKTLRGLPPHPAVEGLLRHALDQVPLDRLSSLAILDRTLKQDYPEAYEDYLEALEADLEDDRSLALLPSRALPRLSPAMRERRAELVSEAVDQLARVPKAVSLANAEELLSRRVYTQPGHFFFELLQNAEDAQARTFRVSFRPDRIEVWHDGLVFDLRDLIGVTSIGQTTKKKQQIGFFGVGFKSVYEVTERPQIYSDVFCFEIVDVSIPRALARPEGIPHEGTTLVLPLREPTRLEELRGIAEQLDPCVLLTLTHLRRLEMGRVAMERLTEDDGVREIHTRDRLLRFAIDESEHRYDGPARERGRTDRTRVLVGIPLDVRGEAVPIPDGTPTVYSFLPTSEPSGLRFLLQGHFDVPVDRERINPESAWNRWILARVPPALGRLAGQRSLLEVLPLPGEPNGPFADLTLPVTEELRRVACLPGRDGLLHRPEELRWAHPDLAALEPPVPLLAEVSERGRAVAGMLGCREFTASDLADLYEAAPPAWDDPQRWEHLFGVL